MKKYEIAFFAAILFLIPFTTMKAQSTFAPDRPGLGTGAHVVERGVWYIELGGNYYDGGGYSQINIGEVMIRYGLSQYAELRVSLNSIVIESGSPQDEWGAEQPDIGLKFELLNNRSSALTLSGLVSVAIPTGYSIYADTRWEPSATLIADLQLSEYWSINSNLGYTFKPEGISDELMFTVTPAFSFAGSKFGGYFGYALFVKADDSKHFIEAGITRLIGNDLQVDINTGVDVSNGDFFIGAGLAFRF